MCGVWRENVMARGCTLELFYFNNQKTNWGMAALTVRKLFICFRRQRGTLNTSKFTKVQAFADYSLFHQMHTMYPYLGCVSVPLHTNRHTYGCVIPPITLFCLVLIHYIVLCPSMIGRCSSQWEQCILGPSALISWLFD